MKNFEIEVYVDDKPSIKNPVMVKASNVGVAVRRTMMETLKESKKHWTKVVIKAIKHNF